VVLLLFIFIILIQISFSFHTLDTTKGKRRGIGLYDGYGTEGSELSELVRKRVQERPSRLSRRQHRSHALQQQQVRVYHRTVEFALVEHTVASHVELLHQQIHQVLQRGSIISREPDSLREVASFNGAYARLSSSHRSPL